MKNERWILIFFLIIGVVSSSIFLYFNTDFFIAQQGSVVHRSLQVSYDGVADDNVFLVRLVRNSVTPSVVDWASFNNGKPFIYVTVNRGSVEFVDLSIVVPEFIVPGNYYVDYVISGGFVDEYGTVMVRVR